MAIDQIKTLITQADLLRLDAEDKWIEVEDGEIVESENNVTFLHLIIIQNLYDILKPFVKTHTLGRIYMDGARYILAGTKKGIQRAYLPDLSFLRAGRMPLDFDFNGDFEGAPDLAVEVASPGQTNKILLPRVTRYLQAGSDEVWLIYPWHKTLWQYRRDAEAPVLYHENDTVDVSVLFPDLTLPMQAIFTTENEG